MISNSKPAEAPFCLRFARVVPGISKPISLALSKSHCRSDDGGGDGDPLKICKSCSSRPKTGSRATPCGLNCETGAFQMGVPRRNSTHVVVVPPRRSSLQPCTRSPIPGIDGRWNGVGRESSRVCPSRFLIIGYHNRLITRPRSLRYRAVELPYPHYYQDSEHEREIQNGNRNQFVEDKLTPCHGTFFQ